MVFAEYGIFKTTLKDNGTVEIKVKNKENITEAFKEEIKKLGKNYPELNFNIVLENKFYVDGMHINNLEKLRLHVGQKLKLLVKVIKIEERKTKNGKYMYTLTMEIPGKKKYLKGMMFTVAMLTIKEGTFYIVDGVLKRGDEKYIQQNEKMLGKEVDYNLMVSAYEEYKDIQSVELNKYEIPRQELHFHTSYSKNDAFITPEALKKAFLENKVDSVALTDHGTVMSFLPFVNSLKKDFKDTGKKIILGSEFYATDYDEYQSEVYNKIEDFESQITFVESENSKEYNFNIEEIDGIDNKLASLEEGKTEFKVKIAYCREQTKTLNEKKKL
ncbi:MAG: PHP domain-containing protein, partial [Cetobacterium sp.]